MVVAVVRYFLNGWIYSQYLEPTLTFTYLGFDWVRPLPGIGMYVLYVVLGVCALAVVLGLFYRTAMAVFFLCFTYAHLIDKTLYLNHYYLFSLIAFLMIFVPANRGFSLDARRKGWTDQTVHPAAIWVLRFQVGVVYFFAGVAKFGSDWLLRGEPLRTWLIHADLPPVFSTNEAALAMSWAGALFDLTVPFFLLWRRTRSYAFVAVVLFHAATAFLFPIGLFPWVMIALVPIFFEPEWPRRVFRRDAVPVEKRPAKPLAPGVRAALVVFVAFQLLWPLRHVAYAGNDLWREDAFRFSWKVMLVEKAGYARFRVVDPETDHTWEVDPGTRLTRVQEHFMAYQPDMILQFAHHLRDEWRTKGVPNPEVYAHVRVSLNGRPSTIFVDPDVDLAKQRRGYAAKPWVLPLSNASID